MTQHYPTTSAAAAVWAIGISSLSLLCFSFTYTPLQAISSWMFANLLTNTSKLNFSSLNSNNNWLKLTSAHLTQYTLLIILAHFWWTSYFFLTRYLLFSNHVTHIFVNFAASVQILISKQSLVPPTFTLSLTTTTHFTMSMSMTWLNMGMSSTHPKFFSSCRRQSPSILPYRPNPFSTLARN